MARNPASADSPPPPISPNPVKPLSVFTSTMVRTKRPQWQPLACRNGASSGTVTVVARISRIFIFCFMVQQYSAKTDGGRRKGSHVEGTVGDIQTRGPAREDGQSPDGPDRGQSVDSRLSGHQAPGLLSGSGTLVRIQPQDHARVSRYHFHPLVVDGVRDGGGTVDPGLQDQVLAGQHAERVPHAVQAGRHRQLSGV